MHLDPCCAEALESISVSYFPSTAPVEPMEGQQEGSAVGECSKTEREGSLASFVLHQDSFLSLHCMISFHCRSAFLLYSAHEGKHSGLILIPLMYSIPGCVVNSTASPDIIKSCTTCSRSDIVART